MSFAYEGKDRIYFGAQATLIETDREMASDWAAPHILLNPAHAWILGKYVEADNPNKNQHYFGLDTLRDAQVSIAHAPMNINHEPREIVGSFVASELIYPTGENADVAENPYIESLAVLWKYYFPERYQEVQKAAEGVGLFYSMECIPQSVSTIGGSDDTKVYPYEGRQSPNYPEELNKRSVPMRIHNPHFVGGALVIPPANPAWSKADARQVSTFMDTQWEAAENLYEGIQATAPDGAAEDWEALMMELVLQFESQS